MLLNNPKIFKLPSQLHAVLVKDRTQHAFFLQKAYGEFIENAI